ncbi:uncharacterized protein LOC122512488 isoform X2 [Leptopilina heterotoma]|uniref:uncharacterized protein LOC122512488 isoform X2 n=1 Tax=Leptopilina heterotoma TaxID=63436 RepID=UPI001CA83520|nr:uncharacterized protein LOC122512488 isoform X2 [Leptopilina heterotoma]
MKIFHEIFCLILFLQYVICRPTEQPTKFSLNNSLKLEEITNDNKNEPTMFQQGMELLGNFADKIRFGRGRFVNSVVLFKNIMQDAGEEWLDRIADAMRFGNGRLNSAKLSANNFIDQNEVTSETQNTVTTVIFPDNDSQQTEGRENTASYEKIPFAKFLPPRTRETARLENESGQSFFEKPKLNPVEGILEKFFKPTPLIDGISEDQKYGNSGDKFIGVGRALVNGFEGLSNFLNAAVDFPVKAAKNTSRGITEALNQLGSKLVGLQ